jgi:hypothetical protein
MISNMSFNYTIISSVDQIAALSYYPLLFQIMILIPLIVLIITLLLRISNRTKTIILFLNLIYSLLLPVIGISIIENFQLKSYIYEIMLNDNLANIFQNLGLSMAKIYSKIGLIAYGYAAMNFVIISYYELLEIYKLIFKIIDYAKSSKSSTFKSLINHIISGIKSCTTSDRNNENKK